MNHNPLVSIIIPLWNGSQYIENCLTAALSQTYAPVEIIVIDNHSEDDSANLVAEKFPTVKLIHHERNLGFGGGCNAGLRVSKGDILILLNQDTEVQADWLNHLVEFLLTTPDIGIVGGKALYPDGTIQHAGGYVNEKGNGSHYGYREPDNGKFDHMQEVDYITGAALAITRQALEMVGELDEGFFPAYYEDVDWCYRVRQAGLRVVYVPQAMLIHQEASLSAGSGYNALYLFHRNRLRFVLKNWPLSKLVNQFATAEQAWLENLGEGEERLIAAMHHVYLYHLLELTNLLTWRKKLPCPTETSVGHLPEDIRATSNETEPITQLLLNLRSFIPMKPARLNLETNLFVQPNQTIISPLPAIEVTHPSSTQAETLKELHQKWFIKEHQFSSNLPFIGSLIASFRHQWNRISTQWYVRAVISQQVKFNADVVAMFDQVNQHQHNLSHQQHCLSQQQSVISQQQSVISQQLSHLEQHMTNLINQQATRQEHNRQRLGEVMAEYLSENGRELAELAQEIQKLKGKLATLKG